MLGINPFHQPKPEDYGFSIDEIPVIDNFKVKAKKKALKRDNVIERVSYFIFYLALYLGILFYNIKKEGFSIEVFFGPFPYIIEVTFLFFVPFIASSLLVRVLNFLIPVSILHDRDAVFVGKDLEMKTKKEALEKYRKDEKEYQNKVKELERKHPNIERFAEESINVYEKKYTKYYVENLFFPVFKNLINVAEKKDEERSTKDWWRNLSPDNFEKEVGEWYKRKGYSVRVTKTTGDGGVDVIAEKGGRTTYIQCKHYRRKVGPDAVRELYGVMSAENVKDGAMVCLDGVTRGAKDFADKNGIIIIDVDKLAQPSIITQTEIRECKDIGNALKYGDYYIMYEGWNKIDDALKSIRNYKQRNDKAYGLFRCDGFYLSVFTNKNNLFLIQSYNLAYIIDAKDFQVIYDSAKSSEYKLHSRRAHSSYNKYFKGNWKRYY